MQLNFQTNLNEIAKLCFPSKYCLKMAEGHDDDVDFYEYIHSLGHIAVGGSRSEGSAEKTSKLRLGATRRGAQGTACRYRFFEKVLC
jgi:hypothetical protein